MNESGADSITVAKLPIKKMCRETATLPIEKMCRETRASDDDEDDATKHSEGKHVQKRRHEESRNSSSGKVPELKLDSNGCPIVPLPEPKTWSRKLFELVLYYLVLGSILPVLFFVLLVRKKVSWSDLCQLYATVQRATVSPVQKLPFYQDPELLSRLWKLPSAKPYLEHNALEYQRREGFCSRATLRCMLKSIPSFPRALVPSEHYGEANPDKWAQNLQQDIAAAAAEEQPKQKNPQKIPPVRVEIVPGDVSYSDFIKTLRRGLQQDDDDDDDDKRSTSRRVAINYLRPALVGFQTPKWVPMNFLFGIGSGHFSPIVGMLDKDASNQALADDEILVGVFDVNHTYAGAYLVPAKRLYESIKAKDLTVSKSRATIILSVDN